MIVEGFDNAWHILQHWSARGYTHFAVEPQGRVPFPRPLRLSDVPAGAIVGADVFPLPALEPPAVGDNPDPSRALTAAEILLATAIAEGWEPEESKDEG